MKRYFAGCGGIQTQERDRGLRRRSGCLLRTPPQDTALPAAVADGSPARRLRDACEPVAMHAVWNRATNERLAQLGLDFLPPDILKRAAG